MTHLLYMQADSNDIPVLFSLNKDLIDTYEDLGAIDYPAVLSWVKNKLTANIDSYTKILSDGRTIGYFRLIRDGDREELDDFYILPEYRGRGIGTAVLKDICTMAKGPMFLCVFKDNLRAIRLYVRFGFCVSVQVSSTRVIMERPG